MALRRVRPAEHDVKQRTQRKQQHKGTCQVDKGDLRHNRPLPFGNDALKFQEIQLRLVKNVLSLGGCLHQEGPEGVVLYPDKTYLFKEDRECTMEPGPLQQKDIPLQQKDFFCEPI